MKRYIKCDVSRKQIIQDLLNSDGKMNFIALNWNFYWLCEERNWIKLNNLRNLYYLIKYLFIIQAIFVMEIDNLRASHFSKFIG